MADAGSRSYSKRLAEDERALLISICRSLGRRQRRPVVRSIILELLDVVRAGRVWIVDTAGHRLPLDDSYCEWAQKHFDQWEATGRVEYLDQIGSHTLGKRLGVEGDKTLGAWIRDDGPLEHEVLFDEAVGVSSVPGATVAPSPEDVEEPTVPSRFENPPLNRALPRAPMIPEEPRSEENGTRATWAWQSSHEWWTDDQARVSRNRRVELNQALLRVAALSARRGWVRPSVSAKMRETLAALREELAEDEEAVVGYCAKSGTYYPMEDQLWRKTSSKRLYLVRRMGLAVPEEVCVLMGVPPEAPLLDRLAPHLSVNQMNDLLSQGFAGLTSEWVADFVSRAAGRLGLPITVEFHGGGINAVAMVFDHVFGEGGWEYSLLVEGNPFVKQLSEIGWNGRIKSYRDRVEAPPPLPRLRRLVAVLSYRCQPWSWLNFMNLDDMDDALAERAAGYRSVAAGGTPIVVDEMLSRQHLNGRSVSWLRVEYMRELYFPLHDWYICDTDPVGVREAWMRSHREIVIGVVSELKPLMVEFLTQSGWRKIAERKDYGAFCV